MPWSCFGATRSDFLRPLSPLECGGGGTETRCSAMSASPRSSLSSGSGEGQREDLLIALDPADNGVTRVRRPPHDTSMCSIPLPSHLISPCPISHNTTSRVPSRRARAKPRPSCAFAPRTQLPGSQGGWGSWERGWPFFPLQRGPQSSWQGPKTLHCDT